MLNPDLKNTCSHLWPVSCDISLTPGGLEENQLKNKEYVTPTVDFQNCPDAESVYKCVWMVKTTDQTDCVGVWMGGCDSSGKELQVAIKTRKALLYI